MKKIVQCPNCKALKFMEVETEKIIWTPLTINEQIAIEELASSSTLMVVTGQIEIIAENCTTCYSQIFN